MLGLNVIWDKMKNETDMDKKYILYLCYTFRGGKRKCNKNVTTSFKKLEYGEFLKTIFTITYCTKNFFESKTLELSHLKSDWDRCLKPIDTVVESMELEEDKYDGELCVKATLNLRGKRYPLRFTQYTWFSLLLLWYQRTAENERLFSLIRFTELMIFETGVF